jgi:hypothetical protein
MPTRRSWAGLLGTLLIGLWSARELTFASSQWNTAHFASSTAIAAGGDNTVYLPIVKNEIVVPRVNVPYFAGDDVFPDHFDETAIFWFGRVTPAENYADVRIGYSDTVLWLRLGIFDRLLWFDASPAPGELEAWDAATIYLDLDGSVDNTPDPGSYRFVSQLSWSETMRNNWQTAYQGNGTSWIPAAVPFTTAAPWRGDAPNNNSDDRGWEARFEIPFTSLGLAGPPAQGALWRLSVVVHDRDDSTGPANANVRWPEASNPFPAASWGELRFGPPTFVAPAATITRTVVIREGTAGADVPDVAVGGTVENLCPGSSFHIWNEWGNRNYGGSRALNIQNQRDIADWPCFAKYFVQFPLSAIPRAGNILSATLTLHHWGNSGVPEPGQWNTAYPSFVHVLTVPSAWTEATLTWNNDPQPMENVSQAWVPVAAGCNPPCIPRSWDVSYAVSKAYSAGGPISFALYSSDGAYDSGKFFSASDVEAWNEVGRPTLTVVWGEP